MALFKNAATEWEKTMTENDLDQMEAQGLDVSKYREKLAARRAKEAEEAKRDRELYKNPKPNRCRMKCSSVPTA